MSGYNFEALSPFDFEVMCQDLASRESGHTYEAFRSGRDGGVDIRFMSPDGDKTIGQCKHYRKSGYSKLKSDLSSKELPKVVRLNPDRYQVYTSVDLTVAQKNELFGILQPYVQTPTDILGASEINSLLRQFPEVEKAHFKLWLASSAVLERIVHSGIYARSEAKLQEVHEAARIFVHNTGYEEAQQILESERVCIISGAPGIGKTTLADILLITSVNAGYQPYILSEDAKEADSVFRETDPQVFYYDDFLGQTDFAEKLNKNEESRLLSLLNRVRQSTNKRLILTSREYVIRQAQQHYEQLRRSDQELKRYILDLAAYSPLARAEILYNHLWFSGLEPDVKRAILADEFYFSIVDHSNYSPRLIEQVVSIAEARQLGAEDFRSFFSEALGDPSQVWGASYDQHLSASQRHTLHVLATFPGAILRSTLRDLMNLTWTGPVAGPQTLRELTEHLRVLEGTFVSIFPGQDPSVGFMNPSIREFVVNRIEEDPELLDEILKHARVEQAERLLELSLAGDLFEEGARFPRIAEWAERNIHEVDAIFADLGYWQVSTGSVTKQLVEVMRLRRSFSAEFDWVDALAGRLLIRLEGGERIGALWLPELIGELRNHEIDSLTMGDIERAVWLNIASNAQDTEDFVIAAELRQVAASTFNTSVAEDFVDELEFFVNDKIDRILGGEFEPSDAADEYQKLDQIVSAFELYSVEMYEAEKYVEEHAEPEPDWEDDDYHFGEDDKDASSEDAIRDLFESLPDL